MSNRNESKVELSQTAQAKRAYEAPKLVEFGSVRELTLGTKKTNFDGGNNNKTLT